MNKILTKIFFKQDTLKVAEELIGKFLVRKIGKKEVAVMITETEAYDGPFDLASHASAGVTPRNAVMFGQGGYFYVYLCYGMYNMLNVVTGDKDYPAAVLIRGVEGYDGPGKLTKYLKIDRRFDKKEIAQKTGLWIEDRRIKIEKKDKVNGKTREGSLGYIKKTARVGVNYAGPVWRKKPYRFILTK